MTKLIYFLYRLVQAFLFPALLFYFLLRAARDHRYIRTIPERLGFLPSAYRQTLSGAIWLHAVSVGEVIAAVELVRGLRVSQPDAPVFFSTGTMAGRAVAEEKLGPLVAGIFFAPVDYVWAVRRVLRFIRPTVVVALETEIWPNLFREAVRTGCGLAIVNGRISDHAARRYARYRWFFGQALQWPDRILAQSETMRERFIQAGAPPERVEIAGNLKYDFEPGEAPADSPVRLFPRSGSKLWIAASTTADSAIDEDDAVIEAFRQLPGWQLILAPRKPERFNEVAQKLARAGVRFARRSQFVNGTKAAVLLLDTMGELAGVFPLADVVFMGGTLAARGGHNVLEPAVFGKPIVVGPHLENFREMAADFRAHRALYEIREPSELAAAVLAAERDPALGERARGRAQAHRGATGRAVAAIREIYSLRWSCYRRPLFALLPLWPLARVWEFFSRRKRARDLANQWTLPIPVISVGNITVGGTGKTPLVLYLAEKLRVRRKPGILSRGYGRHSQYVQLALDAGADAPVSHTGDEPQIFLRSGVAPVGIGPDRFATGTLLEGRFGVDVLILDDGFQHLKLGRTVDIVTIDALDPLGGCEVVPLGRLREPLDALRRAHIFVITRAGVGRALDGLATRLRSLNAHAPVFRARIVPEYWVENETGARFAPDALPYRRAAGFCGLGNPDSFWLTLTKLGIHTTDNLEFGDHHAYTPREMTLLGQTGAEALLTTEKDAVNLCPEADALVAPLKIYWLKIGIAIDNEAEFLARVTERL